MSACKPQAARLVVVSYFHGVPGLIEYSQACRALPCPREGLSPPDLTDYSLQPRTFFRFATRTPSQAAKQPRKGGRHVSVCPHTHSSGQAEPRSAKEAGKRAAQGVPSQGHRCIP